MIFKRVYFVVNVVPRVGTTMDVGDTDVVRAEKQFTPVDTAGIGKRARVAKAKGDAALGGGGLGVDPELEEVRRSGGRRARARRTGQGRAGGSARGRSAAEGGRARGRGALAAP